jgi:hypothetical protein
MSKPQFDQADHKRRRKRLNLVLHNPEEAESQDEIDRACRYAEWMLGEIEEAAALTREIADDLENPHSEIRQRLDPIKARLHAAFDAQRTAITEVEEALVAKFKGRCAAIEVNVPSQHPSRNPHTGKWALLFWHVKGQWGLWTINHTGAINKLTSAPHVVRTAAMGLLEDLCHQLQFEDEA